MTDIDSEAGAAAPPTPRITGLDVTRGFAVMGILAMNIVGFAMPQFAYISPQTWGGGTGPDLWVWAVNYVLVDSKMRGLFSMMFGASTLLVIDSAIAAGRSPARTHYGRMVVLALFGLAHFFLIWFGDILFLYAMCGMLLYAFRDLSIVALRRWAAGFFVIAMVVASAQFVTLSLANQPYMPKELREARADLERDMQFHSAEARKEVTLYRSDYRTMISGRVAKDALQPLVSVGLFLWETMALMLVGMIMFRSGLLRGTWSLDRLARWRNWCLGIGIAANVPLLWWQLASGLDPAILLLSTFCLSVPFDIIMSIGYAALFMGLAQRFSGHPLIIRVAAAGRAAFTNYLGTSILMTGFFYGWGLGMFGQLSRIEVYGPVVAVWVLMLLWSKPWLDHFRYGPLEWLWRSLARLQWQPMRRSAESAE